MRRLLFSAVILFMLSGCAARSPLESVVTRDFDRLEFWIAQSYFSEAKRKDNTFISHVTLKHLIEENQRQWVEKIFKQRKDPVSFDWNDQLLTSAPNISMYNYLKSQGFTPLAKHFSMSPLPRTVASWLLADLKNKGMNELNEALAYAIDFANATYLHFIPTLRSQGKERIAIIKIALSMGADLRTPNHMGVPIYKILSEPFYQALGSAVPPEIRILIAEEKMEKKTRIAKQKSQKEAEISEQQLLKALEKRCLQNDDMAACKKYANLSQDGAGIKLVKEKIDQENAAVHSEEQKFASLKKSQTCQLKEQTWFYHSNTCKKGLAHGKGLAVHLNGQLKFEGVFKKGVRISGLLSHGGTPMYDGPISGGRPDGIGICFHQGEPEECKYYKGKRVDVIYKQRIAMLEQQRILDEKISKMGEMQKAQLDAIEQKIGAGGSVSVSASSEHDGPGSVIGDIVMDKVSGRLDKEVNKLVDKGLNKLFDHLF
ncbi:MAG: hypothetical protein VST69_08725 [Nitrospirota bacterium]|nr:hypothetical protein [Nitrospirota bacterium]